MPKLIPELLWPSLAPQSPESESKQKAWIKSELEAVEHVSLGDKSDVALEEARRLFDAEQDRRKGADSKAGLYLAAITALIPIIATIVPDLLDGQVSKALRYSLLSLFLFALVYLLRAGLWALQTLKVSASTQLSARDITTIFSSNDSVENLVKTLLNAVLYNFSDTNRKIDCIKMAHEFLIRAFLSFVAFLVLQVAWSTVVVAFDRVNVEILRPLMNCFY